MSAYPLRMTAVSNEVPYVLSLPVEFRKHLDDEILAEVNEMIIAYNTADDPGPVRWLNTKKILRTHIML